MNEPKVFTVKKNIHEDNKKTADDTRDFLRRHGAFFINVMSSPGSGKTTALARAVMELKAELRIGVIEADVDSDVDARTIMRAGGKAVQLHTDGLCHLDATMARGGLEELGVEDLDLVFLENIGNLICPVAYDVGAAKNIAVLSVPEGDDKPLKYPMIFEKVDALVVSKIDVMAHFDFDLRLLEERARKLNEDILIFPLSAKTGEGFSAWTDWLKAQITA